MIRYSTAINPAAEGIVKSDSIITWHIEICPTSLISRNLAKINKPKNEHTLAKKIKYI